MKSSIFITGRLKKFPLFYALEQCYRYAAGATIANTILSFLDGIIPPLMVYSISSFINAAITMVSPNPQYSTIIFFTIIIIMYYIYNNFSEIINRYTIASINNSLTTKYKPEMVEKIATYQYEWIEDQKIQDLTQMVVDNMENNFTTILNEINTVLNLSIQIIGILVILFLQKWWLVPIFFIVICPLLIVSFKGGARIYEIDKESTLLTRVIGYLSDVLTNRQSSSERILFGFSPEVDKKFKEMHLKRSNITTKVIAMWEGKAKICIFIMNIFAIICMLVLIGNVGSGAMSSGLYISIIGSIIILVRSNAMTLTRISINMAGHQAFMSDFRTFLLLDGEKSMLSFKKMPVDFQYIEIKNLSFKFSHSEKYILNGVNMRFDKGKSYALIGLNGAGKTTLTRILTGLYNDYEGEILIDGRNIREYDKDYLRNLFSIVYQDFGKYSFSLRENITFGRLEGNLEEVIHLAGLEQMVKRLPNGLDTQLGKLEDDGIDISGGEWQKIAIARALYMGCPFIVLDEPTASLSPMMENMIYTKFAEISKESTVLLISHRLGSTKISDILYVLDQGKVVEEGSHQHLMAMNGLYAKMFNSQKEWYDDAAFEIIF
ncbi:ABC transporter ATP-binding protein [Clostridium sp. YIM B02505]|uniref:ABC transporter ATP-binding protein n=1 Tax=Clostridium yunnanense TaxID=2800325 RepID=A0ABS1EPL7_9CLOT|nr:ABC transporter ATP-binding protein [Clostridium yunnanense]MBK1811301.1 ABC transporter ATP-binding protein [Clostridium yunnanense]